MTHIPLSAINPTLLMEQGILSEKLDPKILALSSVLTSVRSHSHPDVVWALEHVLGLLKGEVEAPKDYGEFTIGIISQAFGFSVEDLKKKGRSAELVVARQVAMYILWRSERYTLDHIGQLLGDRTPATVSHGFQAVIRRMSGDPTLQSQVNDLMERLVE